MQVTIAFKLDSASLPHYTDQYLASLWHIAQANPAHFGDPAACGFAEEVAREIVRRFLVATPPELHRHLGQHPAEARLMDISASRAQGGAA